MTLPPPDSSPDDNDTQPRTTTGTIGPEGVARLLGGAAGLQPASPFAPGDPWPLQADRQAIRSGLVECLRIIAGHYGRRTSVTALTAGLPVPATGITPVLFARAAARADLNARLVERPVDAIAIAPTLPCIMVLKGQQSCIVWDVKTPKGHAPSQKPGEEPDVHPETLFTVEFPETEGQRQDMTRDELRALQTGYVYYVRPTAKLDDRAGPAEIDNARDWFWGAIKQHRKIYQEIGLAAVLINLFALANPLFVMNVYDRVVPNSAFDTLFVLSAGMGIVLIFELVMKTLRAHFLDYAGKKADVKISAQLFEQLLGMTLAARPASAGVLASNMREFEGIRDFFTSATLIALIDLPFAILFIVIIAFIAGPLALVVLAAVPIILLVGWQLQKPMRAIIKESLMENALKNALLFETITGLETIKTQAAEGHVQRRWEELSERAARTNVKSRRVSNFATNFSMFAQQAIGIVTIMVGVYLISIGYVTMGALIATVMLSGRALAPMAQFAALMSRLHQTVAALKQLDDLMKKPVERPAGTHFITLSHVRGAIEFRDIVFKYPGSTIPAVNHLSFSIEAGEHIAIIGAVGSGKTTLQRLLLNMYQPDSGSVQLDGTDVRQIDPGDLRRAIGCVQQSPQLFYGSVRDNITMGHETAPDGAVIKAAEMAGVMEFLRDTQAGLDTPVGERGEQLSGGQRQAVAIARSLLYDPPVMILDEPTASLDPASENRLITRMADLIKGKTTILITHKGNMLKLVDKIILIDRGRLVAYGPRDEIIRKLQAREYTGGENA